MPPNTPKITEADEQLILSLRVDEQGNYRTHRAIADLLKDRGRSLSHSSVGVVLRKHREERAEVARTVLQDTLQHSLSTDLQTLDQVLLHELEVWMAGKPRIVDGEPVPTKHVSLSAWTVLGREVRETVAQRIKLAGVDDAERPDDVAQYTDDDLDAELLRLRNIVAEQSGPETAAAGPGA